MFRKTGGEIKIPQIPDEALATGSNFLKPANLGLKMGDRISFTILGAHTEAKGIYNLPVTSERTKEGSFPLNKTNMGYVARKLGKNSDSWKDHKFDAIVVPQKNPQTNTPVLSWSVDEDSVK